MDEESGASDKPFTFGFDSKLALVPGVLLVAVMGFFIYKLIKNFMDKEKKREDKKRLKEQKKKK